MEDGPQFIVAILLVYLLAWATIWVVAGGGNFLLNAAANQIDDKASEIPFLQTISNQASDKAEAAIRYATWPWRAGSNYVRANWNYLRYGILTTNKETARGYAPVAPTIKDAQHRLSYLRVQTTSAPPVERGLSQRFLCQISITNTDTSTHAIEGYVEVKASFSHLGGQTETENRNVELTDSVTAYHYHTETELGKAEFPTLYIHPKQTLLLKQTIAAFGVEYLPNLTGEVKTNRIVLTISDPEYQEIPANLRPTRAFTPAGCDYRLSRK